jgi:hypothetical protein
MPMRTFADYLDASETLTVGVRDAGGQRRATSRPSRNRSELSSPLTTGALERVNIQARTAL